MNGFQRKYEIRWMKNVTPTCSLIEKSTSLWLSAQTISLVFEIEVQFSAWCLDIFLINLDSIWLDQDLSNLVTQRY